MPVMRRNQSVAVRKDRAGTTTQLRQVQETLTTRHQTSDNHGCEFRGIRRALATAGIARHVGAVVRAVPHDRANYRGASG